MIVSSDLSEKSDKFKYAEHTLLSQDVNAHCVMKMVAAISLGL